MSLNFDEYHNILDTHLERLLKPEAGSQGVLAEAMYYGVMPGGKRMRPLLLLGVCDMLGGDVKTALPYAAAIELIHAYSLIHDDLPAMDNDDFRRGKPSCHRRYGEAMAILAGDSLLNLAFETMLEAGSSIEAAAVIARAAGHRGMIGGQALETASGSVRLSGEAVLNIHRLKTGALIQASIYAGGLLAGADARTLETLAELGQRLGAAFQIKDDMLDAASETGGANYQAAAGSGRAKDAYNTLCSEIEDLLAVLGRSGRISGRVAAFQEYIGTILGSV